MTFVSAVAMDERIGDHLGLASMVTPVSGTRSVRKKDLIHNSYQPRIEVDSQTFEVRADGELLTCEPAIELPLAQRYFLF
jgi:urease subunit alpha